MSNCPNLKDAKEAVKQSTKPQANLTTTIIDSGATQHMFNTLDIFDDISRSRNVSVACVDKTEIDAPYVGSVKFSLDADDCSSLTLRDVLHVPKLKHNLLSVRALTKERLDVSFRRDGMVLVADEDDKTYEIGHAVGDLYHLTMTTPEVYTVTTTTTTSQDPYTLWHHRLGHPSQRILETITNHVRGIDKIVKPPSSSICEGCAYAKSHRQPFPKVAENRSDKIFRWVHSDRCRHRRFLGLSIL